MKKLLILLIAALAIAAIAYFCIYKTRVPGMEKDISSRAQQALDANGINWASSSIDGRDITLTGVAPTEEMKQEAEKLARVDGVNFIDNQMTIAGQIGQETQLSEKEQAQAADGYSLTVSSDESGKFVLDGVMSAEARQQVLAAIKGKVDANNFIDNISIKDIEAPADLPQLAGDMIDKVSVLDKGAAATLSGQKLTISGTSPIQDTLDKVKQAEKSLPKGYSADIDVSLATAMTDKDKVADSAGAGKDDATGKESTGQGADAANKKADSKGKSVAENIPSAPLLAKEQLAKASKATVKKPSKAKAKQCQRQLANVLRKRKVYFNSSSAVIKKSSRKVLNRLAAVAKKCSSQKISVHGHTDATGRNRLNKRLSKLRAQSVVNYLAKKGVNAKHLSAVGHGSSKPIASNKTPKGRARNRRIELTVED